MDQGFSPQEIMDTLSLYSVDADNAPSYRQYAAIDLVNGGRSAAFSGQDCFDYKGHRLGQTYAIAGNILLGPEVLDSMESRFLNTQGTLAEKLMSSLQGAKIQGADKRCIDSMVSSLSAYLIVSKPSDIAPNYYINLNVENVMPQDPIDVLQTQFDALGLSGSFNNKSLFKWLWKQKFHLDDSEGSAASREKHRTIARSLLIDIFETYMIYFSEFKYNDGSSPNLTEQQKSDILNEIYEAFHIYLGRRKKLFASGICICNSYSFCKNYKESN